jgi:hypothetical protein
VFLAPSSSCSRRHPSYKCTTSGVSLGGRRGKKPTTGFTPFFLTYRAETVLPTILDHGAPRVKVFDPNRATEAQQYTIDLLEEARETALVRSARYQQTLRRYHERKIRGRTLEVGNLVLRSSQSTKDSTSSLRPRRDPTPSWRWSNQASTD